MGYGMPCLHESATGLANSNSAFLKDYKKISRVLSMGWKSCTHNEWWMGFGSMQLMPGFHRATWPKAIVQLSVTIYLLIRIYIRKSIAKLCGRKCTNQAYHTSCRIIDAEENTMTFLQAMDEYRYS
jgi:hypothetical protein